MSTPVVAVRPADGRGRGTDGAGMNDGMVEVATGGATVPLRVIAVASGKGGVGKTNVVANLAIALQRRGKRVVVIDADLGLANVDTLLGLNPHATLRQVLRGECAIKDVLVDGPSGIRIVPASSGYEDLTQLSDGQRLLAFNDLFVGARSHVSARYRIGWRGASEPHSSSGVVISTGAGSTGWLSSIFNIVNGELALSAPASSGPPRPRLSWEDPRLMFVVREPFVSRHSRASIIAGILDPTEELRLESAMPSGGVIFSDGVEADYLAFDAGAIARIKPAEQKAHLLDELIELLGAASGATITKDYIELAENR